jgi:hypothetical protein
MKNPTTPRLSADQKAQILGDSLSNFSFPGNGQAISFWDMIQYFTAGSFAERKCQAQGASVRKCAQVCASVSSHFLNLFQPHRKVYYLFPMRRQESLKSDN